jgi:hypothetical protein
MPAALGVVAIVTAVVSETIAEEIELGLTHGVEAAVVTLASLFGMLISVWAVQLAHGWWRKQGETV